VFADASMLAVGRGSGPPIPPCVVAALTDAGWRRLHDKTKGRSRAPGRPAPALGSPRPAACARSRPRPRPVPASAVPQAPAPLHPQRAQPFAAPPFLAHEGSKTRRPRGFPKGGIARRRAALPCAARSLRAAPLGAGMQGAEQAPCPGVWGRAAPSMRRTTAPSPSEEPPSARRAPPVRPWRGFQGAPRAPWPGAWGSETPGIHPTREVYPTPILNRPRPA
jgi:hypothetical protein